MVAYVQLNSVPFDQHPLLSLSSKSPNFPFPSTYIQRKVRTYTIISVHVLQGWATLYAILREYYRLALFEARVLGNVFVPMREEVIECCFFMEPIDFDFFEYWVKPVI